jgi:protein-S-isoprenylcysteine O-methyltransferase Ste14
MTLDRQLEREGVVLFRWRSYLPLVLVPLALIAASQSGYFEHRFGHALEQTWMAVCLGVCFLGLALRVLTVGFVPRASSGRNTHEQRAETLNTTGSYAVVRNPLYLGNYLVLLGFSLATKVWWFPVIASLGFALYYERIIWAEERFLQRKFAEAFTQWAETTPAFLPDIRLWRRPELPFSFRAVLRREYSSFFLIVVVMTLIELSGAILGVGMSFAEWWARDYPWAVGLAGATGIFLTLRALKRHSSLLRVPGR